MKKEKLIKFLYSLFLAFIPANLYIIMTFIIIGLGDTWVIMLPTAGLFLGTITFGMFLTKEKLKKISEIVIIIVLPLIGFFVNLLLKKCNCGGINRPIKMPEAFSVYFLYGISVIAYFISRKRKEKLQPFAEAVLIGALLTGIILCIVLIIQFNTYIIAALFPQFIFIGFPLFTPVIVLILFIFALGKRLSNRGKELVEEKHSFKEKTFGLLMSLPIIGLWAVIHRLIFNDFPHAAFTKTCEWGLSLLKPDCNTGHYLCTVAANGHPKIVKPLRIGTRHGEKIIVNRQLALSNAFEDLLIEKYPKAAKKLRKVYDRFGPPVANWIKKSLTASVVYILVKPLEFIFYVYLLLFDTKNPEERIDKMYR